MYIVLMQHYDLVLFYKESSANQSFYPISKLPLDFKQTTINQSNFLEIGNIVFLQYGRVLIYCGEGG